MDSIPKLTEPGVVLIVQSMLCLDRPTNSSLFAIYGNIVQVAVKVINKTELKETDYMMRNLHREADVLRKIRHENIVQLYEVCG